MRWMLIELMQARRVEYINWINIEGGGDLKKFEQTEN